MMKRHKIKRERRDSDPYKDRDLAHYLHDRVALLRQAMSLVKPRELKAMTPSGLRDIPDRHLQELCLEESHTAPHCITVKETMLYMTNYFVHNQLLGISSKRLCAVLDGADPPTDTDSSSQSETDALETISLDSISSDEAALSPVVEKSKKKRKQHKHKSKQKSTHQKDKQSKGEQESIAGRAGMTVLELLELQARARAIRAQLAADGARGKKTGAVEEPAGDGADDDDEVQIKEEEPEVVELSSDEDKPDVRVLEAAVQQNCSKEQEATNTMVKTTNNLTVIVPQKQTRKIKLNRKKVAPSTTLAHTKTTETTKSKQDKSLTVTKATATDKMSKNTKKIRHKAKKKRGVVSDKAKDGSDHDEITLQLSDSEKMDLLEEFDKHSDEVSSSDEEDSEEDSSDSDSSCRIKQSDNIQTETAKLNHKKIEVESKKPKGSEVPDSSVDVTEANGDTESNSVIEDMTSEERRIAASENKTMCGENENVQDLCSTDVVVNEGDNDKCVEESHGPCIEESSNPVIEVSCVEDIPIQSSEDGKVDNSNAPQIESGASNVIAPSARTTNENNDQILVDKSDGEVSDRSSSEVESNVIQLEVVCISDEDSGKTEKKKNKKKDKKSKKEKKKKRKKSDFREASDQNFYKDIDNAGPSESSNLIDTLNMQTENTCTGSIQTNVIEIDIDSDNVYEVLEISDDSSCYEVEGISVLSKEPTSEEIEALSAKIDHETERVVVVTDEQMTELDETDKQLETDEDAVGDISWKDRYLRSTKVKRVLTTANILNALRKKNKELKKKLEESKKIVPEVIETPAEVERDNVEEESQVEVGSIEHFNTLEGSTKYVDPVKEVIPEKEDLGIQMKKDAKKLLKMYKRLLKYNDMEKKKDPNKPKKKKSKKHKKNKNADTTTSTN